MPGAILAIWGASAHEVYFAGSDAGDGTGPMLLHFDGDRWRRVETGLTQGDLWWPLGFASGELFVVGSRGVVLRYDRATLHPQTMATPDSTSTLYGVWGPTPQDLWAVGHRL
ncbi:MAG: hypothetical protein WCJ30_10245, partial [Deltaproteobacteria bacterium]